MEEMNKKHQREFFDQAFKFGTIKSTFKFYTVVKSSREYYKRFLFSNCHNNKRVLEYGCGMGSYACLLSKCGANVVGIDISEVAIELSKEQAKQEGLKDILFLVMDAEAMKFEDSSFDIVCGTSILHHLKIDRALREIARVLKPEGKAIFIEPMSYNPLINLFRKFTPHLRTIDEHPLTVKDLSIMKKFFHKVQCEFFHLFSLLAVPFRNSKIFPSLLKVLDDLDNKFFRWIPLLKLFAWTVVIILEKPKKTDFR